MCLTPRWSTRWDKNERVSEDELQEEDKEISVSQSEKGCKPRDRKVVVCIVVVLVVASVIIAYALLVMPLWHTISEDDTNETTTTPSQVYNQETQSTRRIPAVDVLKCGLTHHESNNTITVRDVREDSNRECTYTAHPKNVLDCFGEAEGAKISVKTRTSTVIEIYLLHHIYFANKGNVRFTLFGDVTCSVFKIPASFFFIQVSNGDACSHIINEHALRGKRSGDSSTNQLYDNTEIKISAVKKKQGVSSFNNRIHRSLDDVTEVRWTSNDNGRTSTTTEPRGAMLLHAH